MFGKTNLINVKETHLESSATRDLGGLHSVDRFGPGSSRSANPLRISTHELNLRLHFDRPMREKKSKVSDEEAATSKIKIQDDWIDWMLIWKQSAVLDWKQGETVDHTTTDSTVPVLLNQTSIGRRTNLVRRELSPQDAALIIQMNFRAHLIRKSDILKELSLANAKLSKMRNLFCEKNSSYHDGGKFSQDAQDHQRFQKKIIDLLITLDAIEGITAKLRLAKKLMIQELELMLDKADKFPYTKMKINVVPNATEMAGRGAMILRLAFGRGLREENQKRREGMGMTPNEAATLIANRFGEYMVKKVKTLKAHEEVAMAETKMELIRGLGNTNLPEDEKRKMACELFLTLPFANKVANMQDRASIKAMMNELESILEILDP